MKRKDRDALWVVYLVAFEEEEDAEQNIAPFVGMERIHAVEDGEMTAFLRGGNLLSVLQGTEHAAESTRAAMEQEVLRTK